MRWSTAIAASCVRAGLHRAPRVHQDGGTLGHQGVGRFSPGTFTDHEGIETAIEAVLDLAEFASKHRVAARR